MRRLGYLSLFSMVAMAFVAFAAPPTLDNPGKKFRFLSLAEARAIALEHNSFAQPSLLFPGVGLDNSLATPQGKAAVRMRVVGKPGSKNILLTGIPRDPRPAEMERSLNQILLNVENAYWNLYGSYWQLHSREQGLRLAYETWKSARDKYKVGRISNASVAQAEGQYNLLRSQRLQALDTVLDNERQLRAMLGLTIDDGERLVPSDAPTLLEIKPDWKAGWHRAMKKRPELYLARQDVEEAKLQLLAVRTMLVPLHRIFGWKYDANYQHDETPCLRCCAPEPKVDPQAPACVREAHLRLARAYLVLQDQELKAERFLGLYYRRMSSAYFQIKAARAQREAFAAQLKAREEMYRNDIDELGASTSGTLNLLLESQRFWAEALATECQAIVTYNNSLCGWEYAKGEIKKHAHVRLADESPRNGTWVRAVEREQKRTRRHVRHETDLQTDSPLNVLSDEDGVNATVPSLAALWKSFPPLKDANMQTGLSAWKASELFSTRR
jgi:hypothetical protein